MNKRSIPEVRTMAVEKVRNLVVDYINDKGLEPGDKIPSERVLSEHLGISRTTIAKAMASFIDEGILVRRERSGTYVHGNMLESQVKNESSTIAVVMPWLSEVAPGQLDCPTIQTRVPKQIPSRRDTLALQVAHGVLAFAQDHNCRVVVKSYDWIHSEFENICSGSRGGIDGAVVIPEYMAEHSPHYEAIVESGFPLVFVDHYYPGARIDSVVTNNISAARDATRFLISRGHKRIAFFTDFVCVVSSTVDRETGYKMALDEAGIDYDEDIIRSQEIVRNGTWSYELALEHCLNLRDPVTAVFCATDEVLLTTYACMSRMGIRVPNTVELVGFLDEHIPEMMFAPFTRVVQDTYGLGMNAVRLVLDRVAENAAREPQHVELPGVLMPSIIEAAPVLPRLA
ncbi:MAG: GntR family transcriptional regulator [Armatimonadota bacterium]|nr:GntR family transcriptional regulator [bacterium]